MIRLFNFLLSQGLNQNQAEKLSSIFDKRIVLKKGDFYHQETQTCKRLGFIIEGMCRNFYQLEKEDITRWVSLENEFVVSLASFISQVPSQENIQAIKPTEIIVASKDKWQKSH